MVAQRVAFVFLAEQTTSLQLGDDAVDELVKALRDRGEHDVEPVAGAFVQPAFHRVGDGLRRVGGEDLAAVAADDKPYDGSTGSTLLPTIIGTLYEDYTSGQAFASRNVALDGLGNELTGGVGIDPYLTFLDPADAANYATATKSVSITVLKATPVITWTAPADITIGTALSATQLNVPIFVSATAPVQR